MTRHTSWICQSSDDASGGTLGGCRTGVNHFVRRQPDLEAISRRDFLRQLLLAGGSACLSGSGAGCRTHSDSEGGSWQIGAYTRPWDQWDYRTALDGIAEAGFKYAGIMTAKSSKNWLVLTVDSLLEEAVEVGAEVRKRDLKCLSLYAGEFPVAKSIAAGGEGLRKLVDLCVACGSPNLMLAGTSEATLYDAYFKVIAESCDYAAACGVGLSIKPHGGFVASGADCRKGVAQVGHRNFRVWYDPGNILYYSDGKRDPVSDALDLDGLVVGMSVKDFRSPKDVMVTPGTGQVDFRRVLARLKQGGFCQGPLIIECLEHGDQAKVLAEARKARVFLEVLTATLV